MPFPNPAELRPPASAVVVLSGIRDGERIEREFEEAAVLRRLLTKAAGAAEGQRTLT